MFGPKHLSYFKIIARCVSFYVVSIKMNVSYDIHSENYYEKDVPHSRSGNEYDCIRKNIFCRFTKENVSVFYQTVRWVYFLVFVTKNMAVFSNYAVLPRVYCIIFTLWIFYYWYTLYVFYAICNVNVLCLILLKNKLFCFYQK